MGGCTISRRLAGALSLIVLASCQSIPDDYPLTQGFQSRLAKLRSRLLDPGHPAAAARRLRHLASTGGFLVSGETRTMSRIPSTLQRSLSGELGRVTSSGRNLGDLVTGGLAASGRRLSRLATYPGKATSSLNRRFRNLRRPGDRLLLNRELLPMPGDASRQTELLAKAQPAGFWQRILARIRP